MLDGTVSVITGASRGIGREIARKQAAAGASVALVARNSTALDGVAAEIRALGGKAAAFVADVSNRLEVEQTFAAIAAELGPIDTLINNAGVFSAIGPVWEVEPDAWWSDVEINLKSTFYASRVVIPAMLARNKGRILNLIGGGTSAPLPFGSGYSVSKTGIMRLTECIALSLQGTGVVCLAMDPGLVKTDLTRYQAESPAAARYMPRIIEQLSSGAHVLPEHAAALALDLACGRFDRLAGRAIGATEDLGAVEASIDEITASDERVLRVVAFAPPRVKVTTPDQPRAEK